MRTAILISIGIHIVAVAAWIQYRRIHYNPFPLIEVGVVVEGRRNRGSQALPKSAARPARILKPTENSALALESKSGSETPLALEKIVGDGNLAPALSPEALERGWEGASRVRVRVEPSGKVSAAELLESSGYDCLDRAALDAAIQWQLKNPDSESRSYIVPVVFNLLD